jgi:hypothetical protein
LDLAHGKKYKIVSFDKNILKKLNLFSEKTNHGKTSDPIN